MPRKLQLRLGVKTDPVQYRYSYAWLFRFLETQGIRHVQFGTFFELYQLPDSWFTQLRAHAHDCGIAISSMFTAHRELGGFLYEDPAFERVALANYRRLIEVGALLGAECVGSNPGAILRDQPHTKPQAVDRYLGHMKQLAAYAHACGMRALTIEPMSCMAEPPTVPQEIRAFATELDRHRRENQATVPVRYCTDIAHGYADESGRVIHTGMQLLAATLPWLQELHLKNTDPLFHSVFGFGEADRARGVVSIAETVLLLKEKADVIPVDTVIGYLEIPGPKLGRDYSDLQLEKDLRESLDYLKGTFTC